jgi:uncharacterized damage-inducible protein DinB
VKIEEVAQLWDYNYWANARVLDAASRLGHADLTAPAPLSHGSIFASLVHVLAAEWIWRLRCEEGVSPDHLITAADFPTLQELEARWEREEVTMRAYLASLDADELCRTVRYTTTSGVPHANLLWHLLVHVVNHGTQFRGEAATTLTAHGSSPGDLDLLAYLREEQDAC